MQQLFSEGSASLPIVGCLSLCCASTGRRRREGQRAGQGTRFRSRKGRAPALSHTRPRFGDGRGRANITNPSPGTGVLHALGIGGASGGSGAGGSHQVTLQASSSNGQLSSVTWLADSDNSQDTAPAAGPWRVTRTYGTMPLSILMTAQNGGSGTVSCSVTVDGRVVDSHESHGAYAVVQCGKS